MWMITTRGFFSAVQKTGQPATELTIRARRKDHLMNLLELIPEAGPPVTGEGTDYPWRITCSVARWAEACALMATEVNYSNFKNEVKARKQHVEASAYGSIWSALLKIEDKKDGGKFGGWGGYGTAKHAADTVNQLQLPMGAEGGRIDQLPKANQDEWMEVGAFVYSMGRWNFRKGLSKAQRDDAGAKLVTAVECQRDYGSDSDELEAAMRELRETPIPHPGKQRKAGTRTKPKKRRAA
jgi:hypothetical protein